MSDDERIKNLELLYDQLSNWSVGIDKKIEVKDGAWDVRTRNIQNMEEKVEGIYKSVHGIEPNEPDKIWKEIAELKENIKNFKDYEELFQDIVMEHITRQDGKETLAKLDGKSGGEE